MTREEEVARSEKIRYHIQGMKETLMMEEYRLLKDQVDKVSRLLNDLIWDKG